MAPRNMLTKAQHFTLCKYLEQHWEELEARWPGCVRAAREISKSLGYRVTYGNLKGGLQAIGRETPVTRIPRKRMSKDRLRFLARQVRNMAQAMDPDLRAQHAIDLPGLTDLASTGMAPSQQPLLPLNTTGEIL